MEGGRWPALHHAFRSPRSLKEATASWCSVEVLYLTLAAWIRLASGATPGARRAAESRDWMNVKVGDRRPYRKLGLMVSGVVPATNL